MCAQRRLRSTWASRPVWSESSLCAQWVAKDPRFLHADSEDFDQTGRMPKLIWIFAGRTLILLVLSCRGSILFLLRILLLFQGRSKQLKRPPPPTTDWFFYVGVGRGRFYEESWMKDALYVLFCNRWSKKISMANSNPLFLIDLAQKYTFIRCFCLECHWYKSFKVVITVNVLKIRTVKS